MIAKCKNADAFYKSQWGGVNSKLELLPPEVTPRF